MSKMKDLGFTGMELILIIALILAIGLIGARAYTSKHKAPISPTSNASQTPKQASDAVEVTFTSTSGPPKNRDVTLHSDNGVRCITTPCEINAKTWQGKTDDNGRLTVPRENIQAETILSIPPYLPESIRLKHKEGQTKYTIQLTEPD